MCKMQQCNAQNTSESVCKLWKAENPSFHILRIVLPPGNVLIDCHTGNDEWTSDIEDAINGNRRMQSQTNLLPIHCNGSYNAMTGNGNSAI